MGAVLFCCSEERGGSQSREFQEKKPDSESPRFREEKVHSFVSCSSTPLDPLAKVDDPDEFLNFFDCAEDERELADMRRRKTLNLLKESLLDKLTLDDAELDRACLTGQGWSAAVGSTPAYAEGVPRSSGSRSRLSTTDLTADSLAAQVSLRWRGRDGLDADLVRLLDESSEELPQWCTRKTAKRMLNAADGNMTDASRMLNSAVELRIRDRHLLQSQRCDVGCNLCVLGYDNDRDRRPVIFMNMKSVTEPLASWWQQLILTFDKAASYCNGEFGQFVMIADMHMFAPRKFMDKAAAKDIGARLSSVFANRLYMIIVVDFSRIATAAWMLVKPMLKEKTRKKFAFVSLAEARRMVEKDLEPKTVERICNLFDKSRDSSVTPNELLDIARHGAIDPVPLGKP